MSQDVSIVSHNGHSRRTAQVTDRKELLVKVNNSSEEPVIVDQKTGQSEIFNFTAGQTGTFDTVECFIANTGKTNILINGEIVEPGFCFSWEGSFTYDCLLSKLKVITFE